MLTSNEDQTHITVDHGNGSEEIPTWEHNQRLNIPVVKDPSDDALIKTLTRIHTRLEQGWTTGKLYDGQGNYCIIGAVMKETTGFTPSADNEPDPTTVFGKGLAAVKIFAIYTRPMYSRSYRRTIRALKREAGVHIFSGLYQFNDTHRKQSVLNLVDRAIKSRYQKLLNS